MINPQDDLDAIAARIRQAQRKIDVASANALAAVLAAGDDLAAAKALVEPKKWTAWVRQNCFLGASTARLYIQLAQNRLAIEAEASRFPGLSLRAARRLLTTSKPKPVKAEKSTATACATSTPAGADVALIDHWRSACADDRRAFLGQVAEEELLAVLPDAMRQNLVTRVVGNFVRQLPEKKRRSVQSHQKKVEAERLLAMPAAGSA